jgi:uncharacterized protein YraI
MRRDRFLRNLLIIAVIGVVAGLQSASPAVAGLPSARPSGQAASPAVAGLQTVPPTGTVNVEVANVRAGPGTSHVILAQARKGAIFTITGRNPAGDWWQVCCVKKDTTGWIWSRLLTVKDSTANVPVVRVTVTPRPAGTSTPTPRPRPTPTPTSLPFLGWKGEYFNNRDLRGAPVLVRDDPDVNFRWPAGTVPGANVPGTNFSVRWTRTVTFAAGDYQFFLQVDDGARLFWDGQMLIDTWRDQPPTTYNAIVKGVKAGQHTVVVEYYQASGDATAFVSWETIGQYPDWKGEYFNDIGLAAPALLVRNDPQIDFNWGLGSPDPRVPADNWSVRWTRRVSFEAGNYAFFARTSDGVRIYLDGWLVLDEWHDSRGGYVIYTSHFYELGAGYHTVVVEYYARGGIAYAQVWWSKQ